MDNIDYPPLSFYFEVKIGNEKLRFKEVSGFGFDVEYEEISMGGENSFIYKAPKRIKYKDLVLKRGLISKESDFFKKINTDLEKSIFMSRPIESLSVSLLNAEGESLTNWEFYELTIKSWDTSGLDAMKNEVLIENITLSYQYFNKT